MVRALALAVVVVAAIGSAHAAPDDALALIHSPLFAAVAAPGASSDGEPAHKDWFAPPRELTVQLPGMSHHFSRPKDRHGNVMPGRKFNEQNWGIGVQLERPLSGQWDQWVTKTSLGVMKDSLDAYGVYAGHVWQKRAVDGADYNVDLGGGGFLFYRTLRFNGPHVLVPAVLPVLSVEHKATHFGVNVVVVPQCRVSGGTMPGVIYMQFTKAF